MARPAPLVAPPEALAVLLRRIPGVATDGAGMNGDEQRLAKDIQAFAAAAVPHVLELLDSDMPRVRRFAGYVLRDIEGLTEKDLDALMNARRRGDGWIPPAIARIGSPRAIQFLVDDLRTRPESHTQVTGALELAGARAATPLAHLFDSPAAVNIELADAVCSVLGSMASNAAPAVDILVARARLTQGPIENRRFAIKEIGCIGPAARRAIPTLQAIAASEPRKFDDVVKAAILAIGTPEAVPLQIAELRDHPDIIHLRDIAEMRENARGAGPAVVALLTGTKHEVRVAAARTLGFIGYDGASTPLIKLIEKEDDWQLVYVATESLGRLGASAALPALDKVATTHWYPPVRDSAGRAGRVIRGKEQYPASKFRGNFAFEYFDYENVRCSCAGKRPSLTHGPDELSPDELSSLTYTAEILEYDSDGEKKTTQNQTPNVGLKTPAGVLVGADRGEWGGELMYLDGKSAPLRLLDGNVRGIHRHPAGIVVVTGLAHMMSNRGALYRAKTVGSGKYEVSYWKTLPGAPRASGILPNGDLFVSCIGGDIVLKADGRMEMAVAPP